MQDIDTTEMINDLIEAVAEIFPEAHQKGKEAFLRIEFLKIIREYVEGFEF